MYHFSRVFHMFHMVHIVPLKVMGSENMHNLHQILIFLFNNVNNIKDNVPHGPCVPRDIFHHPYVRGTYIRTLEEKFHQRIL